MAVRLLWTNSTLVGAAGNTDSGWLDVSRFDELRISRNVTGGTYAFEIDWSRDGTNVDFTEAITTTEDDQVLQPVAMQWAKLRVRNTGGAAFTAHRTTVSAVEY